MKMQRLTIDHILKLFYCTGGVGGCRYNNVWCSADKVGKMATLVFQCSKVQYFLVGQMNFEKIAITYFFMLL